MRVRSPALGVFAVLASLLFGCASPPAEPVAESPREEAPGTGDGTLSATWGDVTSRPSSDPTTPPDAEESRPFLAEVESRDGAADPEAMFRAAEEALLATDVLTVDHVATSSGALVSDLAGTLQFQTGPALELDARGTFAGQPCELRLASDGRDLDVLGGAGARRLASPPALEEAIVRGWMRMGLLHNLARLVVSAAPDRAEGGVSAWVEVHGFSAGPTRMVNGTLARSLNFTIRVQGHDAAKATLWLAVDSGRPLERQQTVEFPNGSMTVVERYSYR